MMLITENRVTASADSKMLWRMAAVLALLITLSQKALGREKSEPELLTEDPRSVRDGS